MDSVEKDITSLQEKMWMKPDYRHYSAGQKYADNIISQLNIKEGDHVLDIGCGTGKLAKELISAGAFVHGIDIAENCLDKDLEERSNFYFSRETIWQMGARVDKSDYVVCTNVLEHVPQNLIHASLFQINSRMKTGGFFSCSVELDDLGPKHLGINLHKTVMSGRWWADQFNRYWDTSWDVKDNELVAYVKVRKDIGDEEWKRPTGD